MESNTSSSSERNELVVIPKQNWDELQTAVLKLEKIVVSMKPTIYKSEDNSSTNASPSDSCKQCQAHANAIKVHTNVSNIYICIYIYLDVYTYTHVNTLLENVGQNSKIGKRNTGIARS